jgi:hypothetical protein
LEHWLWRLTPVLAKHSKSFTLIDCISVGVDRMQRTFEPIRKQVETWHRSELTDVTATRTNCQPCLCDIGSRALSLPVGHFTSTSIRIQGWIQHSK